MSEHHDPDAKYKRWSGEPFFPGHVIKQLILFFLIGYVLIVLATLFPPGLSEKADPFLTPEHIKPEWYFLAVYQFLKLAEHLSFLGPWAPKVIGVLAPGVLMAALVFMPFFDKNPDHRPRARKLVLGTGVLVALTFVGLTIWGHYS